MCPVCGRPAPPPVQSDAADASRSNGDTATRSSGPSEANGQVRTIGLPEIPGYAIEAELGRGGMGIVYRAYDSSQQRTVAVKTLPRTDPVSLQRFKQEFRSLEGINHKNLVKLFKLVSDGRNWFFSMELIEGTDFVSYVRGAGNPESFEAATADAFSPLREIRLRRGLAQLAEGLHCLHQAGIIHRDVKPSNVLVTAEERVVLLDFGLAARFEKSGDYLSSQDNVVGSAHYMAPEQAASLPVSPASDWYATGALLYEALTGRLPFQGSPFRALLDKRDRDPVWPRDVVDSVPDDLNQLCMELMQRDPASRPSGEEVLERLKVTATELFRVRRDSALPEESRELIGRQAHLQTLENCFRQLERGTGQHRLRPGIVGHGEIGVGPAVPCRLRASKGTVALVGRCFEQESIPFKALDNAIDELARYLTRLPLSRDGSADAARLARVLDASVPCTRTSQSTAGGKQRRAESSGDEQELRRRGVVALRELLTRLGDRRAWSSASTTCSGETMTAPKCSLVFLSRLTRP
jgi:eukaryotic-like serine/threonine-protein kinase